MNRRAALQLLIGGLGLAACTGCLNDLRFWDDKPRGPKIPDAQIEAARRAEELTQRIVELNTFTGLEPFIRVLGVPEAVLFHRGTTELFISEGLVKKCKTDAELAAVICSELGQMMSQKRAAVKVGKDRDRDPIPAIALPGGLDPGAVRDAELAMQEKRRKEKEAHEQSDSVQLAKQLLKGAGFDPAELDRVEQMVKQSERGEAIKKQMAGTAPAPTWNK